MFLLKRNKNVAIISLKQICFMRGENTMKEKKEIKLLKRTEMNYMEFSAYPQLFSFKRHLAYV